MSHSHLPVQHFLKQAETLRSRRQGRGARPEWLTRLIENVADLFEPLTDDGRVGFECHLADDGWIVGMFLGSTEIVGGPEDGTRRYADFEFDLLPLLELIPEIERLRWSALPHGDEERGPTPVSLVTIEGRVQNSRLRLQIYSVPPPSAGPGFRQLADGRRDPA